MDREVRGMGWVGGGERGGQAGHAHPCMGGMGGGGGGRDVGTCRGAPEGEPGITGGAHRQASQMGCVHTRKKNGGSETPVHVCMHACNACGAPPMGRRVGPRHVPSSACERTPTPTSRASGRCPARLRVPSAVSCRELELPASPRCDES